MYKHVTVLLDEAIEQLNIKEHGIYVDMTLGGGGHSSEILKRLTTGKLYCFDQDQYAIDRASERLSEIGSNFEIIKSNFVNIKEELSNRNVLKVDGILFDLGVSSFQFDTPERGFSYRFDAPLDMRMDESSDFSAYNIVNEYDEKVIANILFKYADEKFSRQIARNIVKARNDKPVETTFELVDIIRDALPAKVVNSKGHPAKKAFQALRIAVNDELRVFEDALKDSIELLNKGGRVSVITFHSLEDRICKHMFKELTTSKIPVGVPMLEEEVLPIKIITKKPILPSEDELEHNNRAHSAKLRVCEKN